MKGGVGIPDIEAFLHLLRGFADFAVNSCEPGCPFSCERGDAGSFVIRVLSEPSQTFSYYVVHELLKLLAGSCVCDLRHGPRSVVPDVLQHTPMGQSSSADHRLRKAIVAGDAASAFARVARKAPRLQEPDQTGQLIRLLIG